MKEEVLITFDMEKGCWHVDMSVMKKMILKGLGRPGLTAGQSILVEAYNKVIEELRAEAKIQQ